MRKSPKFSPEVVERAVRMVFEAKDQYPSQWTAIESIACKIGCTAETLRKWVRQAERDQGLRDEPTTADQKRVQDCAGGHVDAGLSGDSLPSGCRTLCGGTGEPEVYPAQPSRVPRQVLALQRDSRQLVALRHRVYGSAERMARCGHTFATYPAVTQRIGWAAEGYPPPPLPFDRTSSRCA